MTSTQLLRNVTQPPNRILIVDDDKAFLALITSMLKSIITSAVIETARSGMEALHIIKQFTPDLVLLDIGLHEMNGLVTFRFIKSISPTTPVYFLSGHSIEDVQDAIAMVKADGYFAKSYFTKILNDGISLNEIMNFGKIESHA
jgi:CheY-like chemotaxis protein